jgi:hypothetical protein
VAIDAADPHQFVVADFETEEQLNAYVQRERGILLAHPDLGLGLVNRRP